MVPLYRPNILDNCINFDTSLIRNSETLNIFSDASMRKNGNDRRFAAYCYGSVAVNIDTIIDEGFQVVSYSTIPCAELMGLRTSLFLALRHRCEFRVINIFSDSAYAVQAIRDFIYDWEWNESGNFYNYNKNHKPYLKKKPIPNQNIIHETYCLLNELRKTNIVNIFHQKAHIQTIQDMHKAVEVFKRLNGYAGNVSFNLIRYVSFYNEYIDNKSRGIIQSVDLRKNYRDALIFKPTPNFYLNG